MTNAAWGAHGGAHRQTEAHATSTLRPSGAPATGAEAKTWPQAQTAVPPTVTGGTDDGLVAELAAVANRRWWNKWTLHLGAAALLVGGFVAGVQVDQAYGTRDSTATRAGQRAGGFPGGTAPSGFAQEDTQRGAQGGAATSGSTATTGTVKLVDGTTVYVQTEDGTVVTVRTDDDTAVKIVEEAALNDLKAGDKVTVEGSGSDGTVTATSITGEAG